MKTTYYANFTANGSTYYAKPIESTNKARLISEIRSIAEGNRYPGNPCSWTVWKKEGIREITVAAGGIQFGSRYRLHDFD